MIHKSQIRNDSYCWQNDRPVQCRKSKTGQQYTLAMFWDSQHQRKITLTIYVRLVYRYDNPTEERVFSRKVRHPYQQTLPELKVNSKPVIRSTVASAIYFTISLSFTSLSVYHLLHYNFWHSVIIISNKPIYLSIRKPTYNKRSAIMTAATKDKKITNDIRRYSCYWKSAFIQNVIYSELSSDFVWKKDHKRRKIWG